MDLTSSHATARTVQFNRRLLEVNSWKLSAEELKKLMQTLVERGTVVALEVGNRGTLYRLREKKK